MTPLDVQRESSDGREGTPTLDANRDWKALLSYLPKDYEQLAVEHKVLHAQWPNSKITNAGELLRFVFVHVGADLPLRQTVTMVGEGGGPKLSAVRLHHKMRNAGPYLGALVERMTSFAREAAPERWDGYELVGVDATTVSGPGSDGVDARIHAAIRLHDLRIPSVQVTDASGGETLRRFAWESGQLVIADRGYSNAPGIAWVIDQGADVLVRVNRGALVLHDDDEQAIDVLDWLRALDGHRASECRARVRVGSGSSSRWIDGRLIGFRLPDNEAADARQRVLREHGPGASDELLEAAGYVALFTTVPSARLSAARCVEAYRLRWQIELQFKRWKSLCRFDRLPNYRDDTIRSWLTAKVLLGLVLDRMASADAELSPPVQLTAQGHRPREPRFGARVGSRRAATRTATVEAHQSSLAGHACRDLADGAA